MLRYLAGAPAPPLLMRLYVRAVQRSDDPRPLDLPAVVDRWPAALRLVDPPAEAPSGSPAARLAGRLRMASYLLDASPRTARLIYDYEGMGRIRVLSALARLMLLEALSLPARLLLARRGVGRS